MWWASIWALLMWGVILFLYSLSSTSPMTYRTGYDPGVILGYQNDLLLDYLACFAYIWMYALVAVCLQRLKVIRRFGAAYGTMIAFIMFGVCSLVPYLLSLFAGWSDVEPVMLLSIFDSDMIENAALHLS
jgi:hypothetical protein